MRSEILPSFPITIYRYSPEPEFVNVYGAQEWIPKNRFRQPMQPGMAGRYAR
jgi:hypothetical protein